MLFFIWDRFWKLFWLVSGPTFAGVKKWPKWVAPQVEDRIFATHPHIPLLLLFFAQPRSRCRGGRILHPFVFGIGPKRVGDGRPGFDLLCSWSFPMRPAVCKPTLPAAITYLRVQFRNNFFFSHACPALALMHVFQGGTGRFLMQGSVMKQAPHVNWICVGYARWLAFCIGSPSPPHPMHNRRMSAGLFRGATVRPSVASTWQIATEPGPLVEPIIEGPHIAPPFGAFMFLVWPDRKCDFETRKLDLLRLLINFLGFFRFTKARDKLTSLVACRAQLFVQRKTFLHSLAFILWYMFAHRSL